MKHLLILALFTLLLQTAYTQNMNTPQPDPVTLKPNTALAADKEERTNNFYDNEVTYALPQVALEIAGEVENPGMVDFSKLQKRTVIVKETRLNPDGSNTFTGAYRYDGYSLFDILCDRVLKKNNRIEFPPIIDTYVEIENAKGEKTVMSWGEIYYPNFLHQSIIATDVMRIVPSKTKELWPLPAESKLVVAMDLITERNISAPVRITVKSYPRSFTINRDMKPMIASEVLIQNETGTIEKMSALPGKIQMETLHTVFYGKGRGIHSTQPFTGQYLKEILARHFPFTGENLRLSLITVVGKDGYRSVYTFSEVMNRNDQAEVLIVPCLPDEDGGKFRLFPACDFFSDRAVKAVSDILVEKVK
jgi:hypothetical protein